MKLVCAFWVALAFAVSSAMCLKFSEPPCYMKPKCDDKSVEAAAENLVQFKKKVLGVKISGREKEHQLAVEFVELISSYISSPHEETITKADFQTAESLLHKAQEFLKQGNFANITKTYSNDKVPEGHLQKLVDEWDFINNIIARQSGGVQIKFDDKEIDTMIQYLDDDITLRIATLRFIHRESTDILDFKPGTKPYKLLGDMISYYWTNREKERAAMEDVARDKLHSMITTNPVETAKDLELFKKLRKIYKMPSEQDAAMADPFYIFPIQDPVETAKEFERFKKLREVYNQPTEPMLKGSRTTNFYKAGHSKRLLNLFDGSFERQYAESHRELVKVTDDMLLKYALQALKDKKITDSQFDRSLLNLLINTFKMIHDEYLPTTILNSIFEHFRGKRLITKHELMFFKKLFPFWAESYFLYRPAEVLERDEKKYPMTPEEMQDPFLFVGWKYISYKFRGGAKHRPMFAGSQYYIIKKYSDPAKRVDAMGVHQLTIKKQPNYRVACPSA